MEVGDEGGADADHGAAHDECAEDAPEEDAVLVAGGDGEGAEDHGDDEDVVDAEGFFDDVAGEVFGGGEFAVVDEAVDGIDV